MTSSLVTVVAAIAAALGVAAIAGVLHRRRSGVLRHNADPDVIDTSDLGLSRTGPTIVHFSAVWCGPCAGVRRVVNQVSAEMRDVAHVEIDMDANPAAARKLSVLSLPTTFIFDAEGRQRYRTSGVPKVADLRSALEPLLA
ncbi:thioredoxin family protein [Mycobacterium sp. NBC_00419]|uniref:TlpA family protein disulfide reductase n=1 Tax=Mycobacterium sp. NBC_00419 TaxID=2975989 RepID=UPI002E1A26BC